MKRAIIAALVSFVLTGLSTAVWADAPNLMTYQGRLFLSGAPASGSQSIDVQLCTDQAGASCTSTTAQSVIVSNGLFKTTFAVPSTPPGLQTALQAGAIYIKLVVNGTALLPTERLGSAPYALIASSATALMTDSVGNTNLTGGVVMPSGVLKVGGGTNIGFAGIQLSPTAGNSASMMLNRPSTTEAASYDLLTGAAVGTGFSMQIPSGQTHFALLDRTAGINRLILATSGNFGIGNNVTNPAEMIQMNDGSIFIYGIGGTNQGLRFQKGVNPSFWINLPSTGTLLLGGSGASAPGTGVLYVDGGNGRVGIGGAPAAGFKLDVSGDVRSSGIFYGNGAGLTNISATSLGASVSVTTLTAQGTNPQVAIATSVAILGTNLTVNSIGVGQRNGGIAILNDSGEVFGLTKYSGGGGNTLLHSTIGNNSVNRLEALDGAIVVNAYQPNPVILATNDYERLRVDSHGSVGIGIAAPKALLHVLSTGTVVPLLISTGLPNPGIEVVTVKNNGYLGLGTQSPTSRLHVVGSAATDGILVEQKNAAQYAATTLQTTGGATDTLELIKHGSTGQVVYGTLSTNNFSEVAAGAGAAGLLLTARGTNPIMFANNTNGLQMMLNSSGQLSVGANPTPTQHIHVYDNSATATGIRLSNASSASGSYSQVELVAGATQFHVGVAATGNGTIGGKFYVYDNTGPGFRLVIASATMGIGTNNPKDALDVVGPTGGLGSNVRTVIGLGNNETSRTIEAYDSVQRDIRISNGFPEGGILLGIGTGARLAVMAGSTEVFDIMSSGKVGIGVPAGTALTQPGAKLHVKAGAADGSTTVLIEGNGSVSQDILAVKDGSGVDKLNVTAAGVTNAASITAGSLAVSGGTTVGSLTSSSLTVGGGSLSTKVMHGIHNFGNVGAGAGICVQQNPLISGIVATMRVVASVSQATSCNNPGFPVLVSAVPTAGAIQFTFCNYSASSSGSCAVQISWLAVAP